MGARVEGKKKKKSVKANVTSKFGSKRKLSRMGKKVKKGTMGPSTEFVTRSNCLKRLQLSLKDFRRLCILKGIYPRVPDKAPKGNDKVYYDIKDISYLQHEPLLEKFREFKSFMKKIRRAAGRLQFSEARRRNELKPEFALDHLVKERYPRFIDALRDMDDALCMIHLFASLPSQGRVTVEKTASCQQLVRQWQYYVARSKTMRKVFVSVKGVYFQAEVMGEDITWLTPHQFTQSLPREVDFRVMLTFLDFYETFMKFVLYKLYNSIGINYPPSIDKSLDGAGCFLLAVKATQIESEAIEPGIVIQSETQVVDAEIAKASTKRAKDKGKILATVARLATLEDKFSSILEEEPDDEDDGVEIAGPLKSIFEDLHNSEDIYGDAKEERTVFSASGDDLDKKDTSVNIFRGLKFFINREVPLEWLQLCCISFGGQVGWEGVSSPYDVEDVSITHQIIDRPIQGNSASGREYIQPQWIFDSVNARMLLPVGAKISYY